MNFLRLACLLVLLSGTVVIPQELISGEKIPVPAGIDSIRSNAVPLSLTMSGINTGNYQFDPLATDLDYNTLAAVGAATLGVGVAVHLYQQHAWWSDKKTKFHVLNDPTYALGIDKVGHFFGGAFLAHLFTGALEAGNMQTETASIWGSSLSFAFQMYVEIEDGFGPDWGFSPGDAIADGLGSAFTLSQYYFPFLKNFQIKFSYYPSKKMREGLHKGNAIDDYEGQKYFLSMRVKNLLPDKLAMYWPSWLNIAVASGVSALDGSGGGIKDYYIGLDLDTEAIPLYGPIWSFVKNTFNYVHFPMPGIRITRKAAFFVFLF